MRDALTETIPGYTRAQVDEFLVAVDGERARLGGELEQANERLRRARAALGMHRVMVAMLLDAHRELARIRSDADAQVAKILADADDEAARILGGRDDPALLSSMSGPSLVSAVPTAGRVGVDAVLDLDAGGDPDGYFEFLRGALSDAEPLGPREGQAR